MRHAHSESAKIKFKNRPLQSRISGVHVLIVLTAPSKEFLVCLGIDEVAIWIVEAESNLQLDTIVVVDSALDNG